MARAQLGAAPTNATDAATKLYVDNGDNILQPTNTQTGTTYTLALSDAGGTIEMNNAAANTVTVPPNSSVAFVVGTVVNLFQYGAGQTTVVAGAGVTVRSAPSGALKIAAQYGEASLRKRATDEWVLSGYITT